jgi:hypothetical protein
VPVALARPPQPHPPDFFSCMSPHPPPASWPAFRLSIVCSSPPPVPGASPLLVHVSCHIPSLRVLSLTRHPPFCRADDTAAGSTPGLAVPAAGDAGRVRDVDHVLHQRLLHPHMAGRLLFLALSLSLALSLCHSVALSLFLILSLAFSLFSRPSYGIQEPEREGRREVHGSIEERERERGEGGEGGREGGEEEGERESPSQALGATFPSSGNWVSFWLLHWLQVVCACACVRVRVRARELLVLSTRPQASRSAPSSLRLSYSALPCLSRTQTCTKMMRGPVQFDQ